MKRIYLFALFFIMLSCNGQNKKQSDVNKDKTTKNEIMQNIDIHLWKKRALEYMNNNSEEGTPAPLEKPYYYLKEEKEKKIIEFSGDDSEGYSLKETLPEPNIYNNIKYYRADGSLKYTFKTLIVNPNIVVGEHIEYDEQGKIIKKTNYDDGFKSSPEKIIEVVKYKGGNIKNELTIVDRKKEDNIGIWHVEFLDPKIKKMKILMIEDGSLKIIKSHERDSDFLKD